MELLTDNDFINVITADNLIYELKNNNNITITKIHIDSKCNWPCHHKTIITFSNGIVINAKLCDITIKKYCKELLDPVIKSHFYPQRYLKSVFKSRVNDDDIIYTNKDYLNDSFINRCFNYFT